MGAAVEPALVSSSYHDPEPLAACGLASLESYLARLITWLEARLESMASPLVTGERNGLSLPRAPQHLEAIASRLGLGDAQARELALALAPHYEPRIAELFGRACGMARGSVLNELVLARLYGTSLIRVRHAHGELFSPRGLLARMKLLQVRSDGLYETAELRSVLLEAAESPASSWPFARLHTGAVEPVLDARTARAFEQLCVRWGDEDRTPVTLVSGPSGTGRTLCARTLAARSGLRVLEVAAEEVPSALDTLELLREALWQRAALLVVGRGTQLPAGWWRRIEELEAYGQPVLIELDVDASLPPCAAHQEAWRAVLRLRRPDVSTRRALWDRFLPPRLRDGGLDSDTLASRFRGTGSDIERLSAEALELARLDHSVSGGGGAGVGLASLEALSRRHGEAAMQGLAVALGPLEGGLDAVLLPAAQRTQLGEVIARVRCRQQVLDAWGFGRRLDYGLGTIALLSGPPGTGKTLTARAVATELGVPLFRVDLSQIVSKWIGETEKHLGALFDAAEASGAALLFDEADALFARRTDVNTSNDRHANLEVGYLLQRIEAFDGLCFLTTNMTRSIDPAFLRRVTVHVQYELPDLELRAELWQRLLPSQAPVEDVDFEALAEAFETLSAADIRSAVLRAAFAAAERGCAIDHDLLWEAGREELRATGALIRDMSGDATWG